MNQSKAEAMVSRLLSNAAGLKYGSVSITAKVHGGKIVEVLYATTESTREAAPENFQQTGKRNGRR